jgi:hypothetical protein
MSRHVSIDLAIVIPGILVLGVLLFIADPGAAYRPSIALFGHGENRIQPKREK